MADIPNLPHWAFADKHDLVPSEVRVDIKAYAKAYSAAENAALRTELANARAADVNCRTCTKMHICLPNTAIALQCVNGDQYTALPPVRLYRSL